MISDPRIYLDNAATTWPKPKAVYDAMDDYHRRLGAPVGRGGYVEAQQVEQAVEEARAAIARLIEAESPERIIFTFNGTDSLNLAIHGILRAGDHVVTTVVEHNSVLRPLRKLEKNNRIKVTRVGCDVRGVIDPDDVRMALLPETKLIVVTHASNVTGAIQPVTEIGRIARERGILSLVDAAQTLGHLPISVGRIGADLLAAPGHKGLLGPLGTGILYIRPGVEQWVDCVRQGGTGSSSSSDEHPDTLPHKYESGNQNAPGIVGLGAGVKYLEQRGIEDIRRHAVELTAQLMSGLAEIPGIQIHGPQSPDAQIGVVSVSVADYDAPAIANRLAEEAGVEVRAGFHCAAFMHRALDTIKRRGTVRFSVGPFNTEKDIDAAIKAVSEIARDEAAPKTRAVECPCVHQSESPVETPDVGAGRVLAARCTESDCQTLPISRSGSVEDLLPGLTELWRDTLGDSQVKIAVLDGPVDVTHPSLREANLTTLGGNPAEPIAAGGAASHGTHVASIIFGQHGSTVRGIAPQCSGLIRPIYRDAKDGSIVNATQQDLAEAIDAAVAAGANIINISGGEASPSSTAEPELARAIEDCERQGVLVVAAAGNGGCGRINACDCVHVPGALPSVLAVGAMDGRGRPLEFSNCGSDYQTQGLLAPGKNIPGAAPGHGVAEYSGTSFATPIVSGVAALLMSLQRKRGVTASAASIRDALLQSVDPCDPTQDGDCRRLLAGRVNVQKAIAILNQGESSMSHEPDTAHESPCGCPTYTETTDGNVDGPAPSQVATAPSPAGVARAAVQRAADRSAMRAAIQPPRPTPRTLIQPARCTNEADGSLVYVIGQLAFDFGTTGNRTSLNNNFASPKGSPDIPLDVASPFGLLAYLLGYRVTITKQYTNGAEEQSQHSTRRRKRSRESEPLGGPLEVCGHLHDAAFVNWVLTQASCPKYVIRPTSAYSEAAYLEFIRFLIEQYDFIQYLYMPGCDNDKQRMYRVCDSDYVFEFQLRGDCLRSYYCCHGGEVCPCAAIAQPHEEYHVGSVQGEGQVEQVSVESLAALTGSSLTAAEYIGVAGEVCGSATLLSGQTVPAITPALRSCLSWSTAMLLDAVLGNVPLSEEQIIFLSALSRTLGEQTHNDGRSPEERALNFVTATLVINFAALATNPVFRRILSVDPGDPGSMLSVGFDNWMVAPAPCREPDTLPYDVTLIFYNTSSQLPSRVFVTFTVNVADVNPVSGEFRLSIRR